MKMPKNCVAQAILFVVRNYNGKNLLKRSNQMIYEGLQFNSTISLSSNPCLMFLDFTWRRIGKEEKRKNVPYLSTLLRNIRNGFELRRL